MRNAASISRRTLLAASAATLFTSRIAFAKAQTDKRLVVIILRGALDGLAVMPPHGDPRYADLRGDLAIRPPGALKSALPLDGFFGLHPAMVEMHRLYGAGEAVFFHAISSPYRQRSHFDGQDVLENGAGAPLAVNDGWLNRALTALPGAEALAIGQNVPLILRGEASAASWAPSYLKAADDDTVARLMRMYADDALLQPALEMAAATDAAVGEMGARKRRGAAFKADAEAAAKLLAGENGARIAVLQFGGWDTHVNQGAETGQLANRLQQLDAALGALKTGLGPAWKDTAVIVATEFGRTARVNGNRGTDHGAGAAAFVLGGAVNGGRIAADWPGLGDRDLYENRDLRPTADIRSVFKGVLHDHMKIPAARLENDVFPDSAYAKLITGLVA